MGTEVDILTGALDHLVALGSPLPIAWPNVNFTPPSTGEWLEARHFPNTTRTLGWQADAKSEYLGFVQISVYFRPNTGIVTATTEAQSIADHFAKGTLLGPVRVSQRASLAAAVFEDAFGFIPVTIPYRGIA